MTFLFRFTLIEFFFLDPSDSHSAASVTEGQEAGGLVVFIHRPAFNAKVTSFGGFRSTTWHDLYCQLVLHTNKWWKQHIAAGFKRCKQLHCSPAVCHHTRGEGGRSASRTVLRELPARRWAETHTESRWAAMNLPRWSSANESRFLFLNSAHVLILQLGSILLKWNPASERGNDWFWGQTKNVTHTTLHKVIHKDHALNQEHK